jgi:hypothetical protein
LSLAALLVLSVTVLVGVLTLAEFADPRRMATMPGAVALVAIHLALALGSAIVWIIFLVTDSTALGWIGFAVIGLTAVAGLTLYRRSSHHTARVVGDAGDAGAEEMRAVSPGLVVVHGAVATLTVVFALIAAGGVGR